MMEDGNFGALDFECLMCEIEVIFRIFPLNYFEKEDFLDIFAEQNELMRKFMEFLFSDVFDDSLYRENVYKVILAKKCLEKGIISENEVREEFIGFSRRNEGKNRHLVLYYLAFGDLFDEHKGYLEKSENDPIFMKWYSKIHIDCIPDYFKHGYPVNSIQYALKYDDIVSLEAIMASPSFDYKALVACSPIEPYSNMMNDLNLLEFAAFYGSIKCFRRLFIDETLKQNGGFISSLAIIGGNLDIVNILSCSGISFGYQVFPAIKYRRIQIIDWIFNNFDIHDSLDKAIIKSVKHRNLYMFERCLNEGTSINAIYNDYSPLIMASIKGHSDIVKILLEHPGIDVGIRYNSMTSLHWSSALGNLGVVKVLVNDGRFDINETQGSYFTALHFAAQNGHSKIVEFLCQNPSCDINSLTLYNETPLHLALSNLRIECAEILLHINGVNTSIKNSQNKSVMDIAIEKKLERIIKLIK